MSSPLRKEPLTICASVMCNCGWKRSICAIIVQLLLHGAKNGWGGYIGGNKDLQLALNLSFLPIHCLHKFTFNQHLSNELASIVPKNMNTIESRVSRDASPMHCNGGAWVELITCVAWVKMSWSVKQMARIANAVPVTLYSRSQVYSRKDPSSRVSLTVRILRYEVEKGLRAV